MAKIYISAGHGGRDRGAVGNGKYEKDINLQLALEVGSILSKSGHVVQQNRTTDVNGFGTVVPTANSSGADFFIEIHHNAGGGTGTEAYYYQHDSSDKPGPRSAAALSAEIAKTMGWPNRGAKKAAGKYDFMVVRETTMPAVLLETCFIDNSSDMGRWNVKTISMAIARAICSIWGGTVVDGTEIADKDKEIAELKKQVTSLTNEKNSLTQQNGDLNKMVGNLNKDKSDLEERIAKANEQAKLVINILE